MAHSKSKVNGGVDSSVALGQTSHCSGEVRTLRSHRDVEVLKLKSVCHEDLRELDVLRLLEFQPSPAGWVRRPD